MTIQIIKVFLNTAVYVCRQIGASEEIRMGLKQQWAQMVLKTFGYSLEIKGRPPISRAQMIVGNHISFLDIPVLMGAFPEVTFIAKKDVKKWPIIGAGAAAVGTIFVDRNESKNRKAVRDQIVNVLKEKNQSIVVFPSGTTTLYEQRPWKRGAFEIAQQADVPVQLFRIDYNPLRPSAYIDQDNLLSNMARLSRIEKKAVTLTWLDQFDQIDDPDLFSEKLRQQVAVVEPKNV